METPGGNRRRGCSLSPGVKTTRDHMYVLSSHVYMYIYIYNYQLKVDVVACFLSHKIQQHQIQQSTIIWTSWTSQSRLEDFYFLFYQQGIPPACCRLETILGMLPQTLSPSSSLSLLQMIYGLPLHVSLHIVVPPTNHIPFFSHEPSALRESNKAMEHRPFTVEFPSPKPSLFR